MILAFKKNLSTFDRILRTAIGLYMLWLVFTGGVVGLWAVAAAIFALHLFAGAVLSY